MRAAALLLCAGLVSGCTYTGAAQDAIYRDQAQWQPSFLAERTHGSVDAMVNELWRDHPDVMAAHTPAVVGSIADIADVNRSTPLGNMIADQVRTALVRRGMTVTDMRLRSTVKLDPYQGEMVLSRERNDVYAPPLTGMFVTGTYAVAHGTVFISLKVIRSTNADILAAADYQLPLTADVDRLLGGTVVGAR